MNFLRKLLITLFGYEPPVQPPAAPSQAIVLAAEPSTTVISTPPPADSEETDDISAYAFVLAEEAAELEPADQWYLESTQKQLIRRGSAKAFAWLANFVPFDIAKLLNMPPIVELGPDAAAGMVKEIRGLIREQRKSKQPHADLLRALFGASVLADFSASLAFADVPGRGMAKYVSTNEIQDLTLDFQTLGYQCSGTLVKTDVKWLVDEFGEPSVHQTLDALNPDVRKNAISRYCWSTLRSANDAASSAGAPQQTMQEWIRAKMASRSRTAAKRKNRPVSAAD